MRGRVKRGKPQRVVGWILIVLTLPVAMVANATTIIRSGDPYAEHDANRALGTAAFGVTLFILGGAGTRLARSGRRRNLTWRRAHQTNSDPRPPVLYLRSFAADYTAARSALVASVSTHEEDWARAFHPIGPFITLGDPDEPLPQLGAEREYLGSDWQAHVADLMSRATLVVILLGSTPALMWECRTVVQQVDPRRVVLLVPLHRGSYETVKALSGHLWPKGLPVLPRSAFGYDRASNLAGLLIFDDEWNPQFRETEQALVTVSTFHPGTPQLLFALRPVFATLGIRWTRPRPGLPFYGIVVGILAFIVLFHFYG